MDKKSLQLNILEHFRTQNRCPLLLELLYRGTGVYRQIVGLSALLQRHGDETAVLAALQTHQRGRATILGGTLKSFAHVGE